MKELDAAWLAGLVEGEGTLIFTNKNAVALTVFMTDLDVLERCREVAGVGSVRGPYGDGRPNRKPIYKWSVNKADHVREVLGAIRPFMGQRRAERIDAALERLGNIRGRTARLCDRGHNNWKPDGRGKRYCRDCASDRQRERRAREMVNS